MAPKLEVAKLRYEWFKLLPTGSLSMTDGISTFKAATKPREGLPRGVNDHSRPRPPRMHAAWGLGGPRRGPQRGVGALRADDQAPSGWHHTWTISLSCTGFLSHPETHFIKILLSRASSGSLNMLLWLTPMP